MGGFLIPQSPKVHFWTLGTESPYLLELKPTSVPGDRIYLCARV